MFEPTLDEKEKFSKKIHALVKRDNLSYLEAVTEHSEEIGLELDVAAKLITPPIIAKISEEAMKNNLIEKYPTLPI